MAKFPLFSILKHRISLLENFIDSEISEDNWQEKCTTFAQIKPLYDSKVGSLENFNFGHVVTEGYFMFKIRAIDGVHNKMRICFKERLFEIKRIIDIEESQRFLQIIALEIVD
jgi:SPP1 family predicted phage head-tail adaptor